MAERAERDEAPRVALWVDSFSQGFSLGSAAAAVALLRTEGFDVDLVDPDACCGLTWETTGQPAGAARRLDDLRAALRPWLDEGVPAVGLEPSCTARAREQGLAVLTLSELLTAHGYRPPSLVGHTIVVQPHCHHRAVIGWETDRTLLAATGADIVELGTCCGLAGNFGVETGHHELSVAVAELELLPALRAHPDAIVLADGFSCRTQVDHLDGRDTTTLAELLLAHRA